ncbi:unnamed protein product, partial [Polarella glacialis]
EGALDQRDSEIQLRRSAEAEKRSALEREVETKDQEEAQRKAEKAERKAKRKEAREAEKARVKAEQDALEVEAARAVMYPVSKTSQLQGTRLVSCVGDPLYEEEEYEWDGDPAEAEGDNEDAAEAPTAVIHGDGMDACFTDAILGDAPAPIAPAAGALFSIGSEGSAKPLQEALFDRLKTELKDTFVSYLCASMPSSLLKKYQPDELIGCLQVLLQELRRCIAEHGLEDVQEEEPTSLAEDLKQNSPMDWLQQLQSTSSWALRQKYEVTELIDTYQGLAQTCFERLTDELGPTSRWAAEGSLLHIPVAVARAPSPSPQRAAE